MSKENGSGVSRRTFIGTTAAATAGFTILPSTVVSGLGHIAPSDKLNIAGVGVGGMGRTNLRNIKDQNIVALVRCGLEIFAKGPLMTIPMPRNSGTGERCMMKWARISMQLLLPLPTIPTHWLLPTP